MKELGLCNSLKNFHFVLPTRIEYGPGVTRRIVEEVRLYQGSKAFIVTDPGVKRTGIVDIIINLLIDGGITAVVFDEVEANPRAETVNRAAGIAKEQGIDIIIAVGGGSSMDAAKGIAAVVSHGGTIYDYEGMEKLTFPVTPLIAIPTTAGTGSEVTIWAVITDMTRKIKMAVGSIHLAPRVALVDPELTISLPPSVTAATGMDALTHAIESYTARCSNPISDALALYAIEMIAKHLKKAVEQGDDTEARGGMILGSLLAGISFGSSDTGAVHSMAEALGAVFDVPHGVANAIFLPYVMGYNLSAAPEHIARVGLLMGVDNSDSLGVEELGKRAVVLINNLNRELKIPVLKQTGVVHKDLESLAVKAEQNLGTPDNAREIDKNEFFELFRKALAEEDPV